MKKNVLDNFIRCYNWDKFKPNYEWIIYVNPEYVIFIECVDIVYADGETLKGYKLGIDNREERFIVFTDNLGFEK